MLAEIDKNRPQYSAGAVSYTHLLPMLIQLLILFALYRVIWNIPAYVASVKDVFTPLVNVLLKTQGTQQFLADTVGNQVNFQRLGSVSYTHLDVYKRQHVYCLINTAACCCPVRKVHHPEAVPAYL